MSSRIRAHLRSNIIGYVALFLALSGGAYAASVAPKNSVVSKSIKNGQVKKRDLGRHAVSTSKLSRNAVAPKALNANNSERLGGMAASGYQQRVTGNCSDGTTVESIGQTGTVACTSPVMAISATPTAGNNTFTRLSHSDLQIATVCHDGATTEIEFQNLGGTGTLNWLESDGTTVSASGVSLTGGSGTRDFSFAGKRLEGQFIFANAAGETTVNLHAFDGGTGCEVRGTAEFSPN